MYNWLLYVLSSRRSSPSDMSDTDVRGSTPTGSDRGDLSDAESSDSDATVSFPSTASIASTASDGSTASDASTASDDNLFPDPGDSMSEGSIDLDLDGDLDTDELEPYADDTSAPGSPVQVLSEAEQLEVSSIVEVRTEHGEMIEVDEASSAAGTAASLEAPMPRCSSGAPGPTLEGGAMEKADPPSAFERSALDDDGTTCTICFEAWTNSGEHRLVSLKCGHLYGQSCIEKWLRGQPAKCPQCNASARKGDVRPIYALKLKVLDTTELDRTTKQLNLEREERQRCQMEMTILNQRYNLLKAEYEKLKSEFMDLKEVQKNMRCEPKLGEGSSSLGGSQTSRLSGGFVLNRVLELGSPTSCRNLATSAILGMLVISQSQSSLFRGYGVRKVSTMDFKTSEFILIHQGEIRDIAFHSHDALVLSASLDKSVKLTSVLTNTVVQTYTQTVEAWSCAWDQDNPNRFYVGLKNGTVALFDLRQTGSAICLLPHTGRSQPVVAMQHVPHGPTIVRERAPSGLLISQFQLCTFFEKKLGDEYKTHPFQMDGNCTSVSFEPTTRHLLVTCRPSPKVPYVTHTICSLSFPGAEESEYCSYNVVQVFHGGSSQVQLSRSRLCVDPGDVSNFWVCAGDEYHKAVLIWDAATGKKVHHLNSENVVLDVCPVEGSQGWCLATLTKSNLSVYGWRPSH